MGVADDELEAILKVADVAIQVAAMHTRSRHWSMHPSSCDKDRSVDAGIDVEVLHDPKGPLKAVYLVVGVREDVACHAVANCQRDACRWCHGQVEHVAKHEFPSI